MSHLLARHRSQMPTFVSAKLIALRVWRAELNRSDFWFFLDLLTKWVSVPAEDIEKVK